MVSVKSGLWLQNLNFGQFAPLQCYRGHINKFGARIITLYEPLEVVVRVRRNQRVSVEVVVEKYGLDIDSARSQSLESKQRMAYGTKPGVCYEQGWYAVRLRETE